MFKDFIVPKEERNNKENNKKPPKQTIIIAIVVIVLLAFFLIAQNGVNLNIPDTDAGGNETMTGNLLETINTLGNNYSLEITKTYKEEETVLDYNTDGSINSMESVIDNQMYSYIEYNNTLYKINYQELEKVNDEIISDYFFKNYYDLSFLKTILSKSKLVESAYYEEKYEISLTDYFKEYNYVFNTNFKPILDNKVSIEIKNNGNTFIIDYTHINTVINNDSTSLKYEIKISNVNENDFSSIGEYINANNN